nr:MAG TPA: hypothetical protein [Caudoviricetes sp.]
MQFLLKLPLDDLLSDLKAMAVQIRPPAQDRARHTSRRCATGRDIMPSTGKA